MAALADVHPGDVPWQIVSGHGHVEVGDRLMDDAGCEYGDESDSANVCARCAGDSVRRAVASGNVFLCGAGRALCVRAANDSDLLVFRATEKYEV